MLQRGVIKLNGWGFCFGLVAEWNEGQRFSELGSSVQKKLTDPPSPSVHHVSELCPSDPALSGADGFLSISQCVFLFCEIRHEGFEVLSGWFCVHFFFPLALLSMQLESRREQEWGLQEIWSIHEIWDLFWDINICSKFVSPSFLLCLIPTLSVSLFLLRLLQNDSVAESNEGDPPESLNTLLTDISLVSSADLLDLARKWEIRVSREGKMRWGEDGETEGRWWRVRHGLELGEQKWSGIHVRLTRREVGVSDT